MEYVTRTNYANGTKDWGLKVHCKGYDLFAMGIKCYGLTVQIFHRKEKEN